MGPAFEYVELQYHPSGNLKDHVAQNKHQISGLETKRWARQMIEGVEYIHTMGVRHSDLRLDQWLLDSAMNARLTVFDGSGFDGKPSLRISETKAMGIEEASHFLPKDLEPKNTSTSPLFVLGSSLYELAVGQRPYPDLDDAETDDHYRAATFPPVEHLLLGIVMVGCWNTEFASTQGVIRRGKQLYEL